MMIRFFQHFISPVLSIVNRVIPKNSKRIVLYSNLGFRDNVQALYRHLITEGYNNDYKIVCVSNNFYSENLNVNNVVSCGILKGFFYFLTSKYFFFCFGKYPVYPSSRQIVVNLLHGMPIKRIGNQQHGNETVRYDYFTTAISYSDFFSRYVEKSFGIDKSKVMISGSPRIDFLDSEELFDQFKRFDSLFIWMPTYRDGQGKYGQEFSDLANINKILVATNSLLIIKPHPLDTSFDVKKVKQSNILVIDDAYLSEKGIELYQLLGQTNALITDYSSVSIDYLATDKPIAYILDDLDSYRDTRGFNFDINEILAGPILHDENDLVSFINDTVSNVDNYKKLRSKVRDKVLDVSRMTGNCQRILDGVGIKHE